MIDVLLSRRAFGAGATAVGLASLIGCSGDDDSGRSPSTTDQLRVLTGVQYQSWEAFLYVAEAKGWFAEAGLAVEVLPGEGTRRNLELLIGGQAEVATLDVTAAVLEFAAGTTDFVLTCVLHANLLACVMVLEDSGIEQLRDLEGRSIAVIPGGTNTLLFPALGRLAGFDAERVEQVALEPPFPQYLGSGTVDASMEFLPNQRLNEIQLQAQGVTTPVRVFPYADLLPQFYGSGFGVTRAFAGPNADLVRRFNRAALRALQYSVDNPEESAEIFAQAVPNQNLEAVTAGLQQLAAYVHADEGYAFGEFSPDRLAQTASSLEELGLVDRSVGPEEYLAPDLYS
jgi:NitT/TauT family transport system substrate-binding protein